MNYEALAGKVSGLLSKYGVSATISHASSTVDPLTGEAITGNSVEFSAYVIKSLFKKEEIDGQEILKTDLKLVCETLGGQPKVGYKIQVGNKSYRIVSVKEIEPSTTSLAFILQVRN